MALRAVVEKHIDTIDWGILFSAKPPNLLTELKNKATKIFPLGQYKGELGQNGVDTWIFRHWEKGCKYGWGFKSYDPNCGVRNPASKLTSLDCDDELTSFAPVASWTLEETIKYIFSNGADNWSITRDGGGIKSVIDPIPSPFRGWTAVNSTPGPVVTAIDNAIKSIGTFGSYTSPYANAYPFYQSVINSNYWSDRRDLTVLFHLVYPQFFPVWYIKSNDGGLNQAKQMERLLDIVGFYLGVSRQSINLRGNYEHYSAAYRLLLVIYDYAINACNIKQTPHFDYFTQFLTDMDVRANEEKLLLSKKAMVYYGVPGTGKTHAARRLAEELAAPQNVKVIQFHPNYSYQDFIVGIRPQAASGAVTYQVEPGILYRAAAEAAQAMGKAPVNCFNGCTANGQAEDDKNQSAEEENIEDPCKKFRYVLIIDEINRADLAKVLGEVMYCIEYRGSGTTVSLPNLCGATNVPPVFDRKSTIQDPFSKGADFYIPENLYIIGTMNNADRSISGFDMALRRRFAWVRKDFCKTELCEIVQSAKFSPDKLQEFMNRAAELNKRIERGNVRGDDNYDGAIPLNADHIIGHAYFKEIVNIVNGSPVTAKITAQHLEWLWLYHLHPLLEDSLGYEVNQYRGQIDTLKDFFCSAL